MAGPTTNLRAIKTRHHASIIFDVLYGFIPVTEWEEKIVQTPFFQRLRWIRQLGFANFIFPGAEHTRFAHALGVMHSMDQMLRALGLAVTDDELFNPKSRSERAMFHKSLRIAAMLHDIGTFPFSHAIEHAYIRHGRKGTDIKRKGRATPVKDLPNNHEHLGSYIIKNTKYDGGITRILEDYGFDAAMISKMVKGESPFLIGNQLMHSDLDCDRMDYLLRDSHYTGIRYGQFDRDYILANLETFNLGRGQMGFGVRENAVHALEDFLISRFSWYSQVIKNPASAKFDILGSHLAEGYLGLNLIHQFHDLLDMIDRKNERFFWWNDMYFMTRAQEIREKGSVKDSRLQEINEMILYRHPPRTVRHPMITHKMLRATPGGDSAEAKRKKLAQNIHGLLETWERAFKKYGTGKEFIVADIPEKDVVFTAGFEKVQRTRKMDSLYAERDPVKIVKSDGKPALLVEYENTLMHHLSEFINFVPNVYANEAAMKVIQRTRSS